MLDWLPAVGSREEAAIGRLDRPRSLAYALRADVECLLADLVVPLAASLEASARHTEECLREEWLAART